MSKSVITMGRLVVSVLISVICAIPAGAQTAAALAPASSSAPSPAPDLYPYVGRISAADVYIRSGPGEIWYPTGKFDLGQQVIVYGEKFGWLKIAPTPQCFSYVAKEFVQADPADLARVGSQNKVQGMIIGNQVRVRAGSVRVSADKASEVQVKLDNGAAVQIIGQDGDFYRIVPPEGCYFWVLARFVNRSGPLTDEVKNLQAGQASQQVGGVPQTETSPAAVPNPGSPAPVENLPSYAKEREQYTQLLNLYNQEIAKPVNQRNFAPLRQELDEMLKTATSPAVKSGAEILNRHVMRAQMVCDMLDKSRQQDQQLKLTLAQIDKEVAQLAVMEKPLRKEDQLVVKGRLAPSAVFTTPGKQQRFLVLDDQEQIIYYAVSAQEGLNLNAWVGKNVSMSGQAQYDTFGKVRILNVEKIVEILPGQ